MYCGILYQWESIQIVNKQRICLFFFSHRINRICRSFGNYSKKINLKFTFIGYVPLENCIFFSLSRRLFPKTGFAILWVFIQWLGHFFLNCFVFSFEAGLNESTKIKEDFKSNRVNERRISQQVHQVKVIVFLEQQQKSFSYCHRKLENSN